MEQKDVLLLGHVAHLRGNPFWDEDALEIIENGALLVDSDGFIRDLGPQSEMRKAYSHAKQRDFGSGWIVPGMVDGHVHFPQMDAMASQAGTLLDWLSTQIYPAEMALSDPVHAEKAARRFVRRLLASGTTTAMVFGSQFVSANLALYHQAEAQGLNLFSGLTMMDVEAPPELCQTPQQAHDDVLVLAKAAQSLSRVSYTLTPRFALATSRDMLDVCKSLVRALPGCLVQTHINESNEEIQAVAATFPECEDYLDVYERAGLIKSGTVLAHNIHVSESQLRRIAAAGAAVCHCPNSNLFLGSGLFPLQRHLDASVPVLLGSDIGAGLRLCLFEELCEAYKVQKLQGLALNAGQMLYLATLAGAEALALSDRLGNFQIGKQADLVIFQPARDTDLAIRLANAPDGNSALFALIMLATQHLVEETHVQGRVCYRNGGIAF